MAAALTILIWLLAVFLLLVILAIAMPLRIELVLRKDLQWRYLAALRPYGRFGPRIVLSNRKKKSKAEKTITTKKKKGMGSRFLRSNPRAILQAVVRLVADIFHSVHFHQATLDAKFGLDDPSETGQAFGMLAPVIYGSAPCHRVRMNVEPVFDHATLTGTARLDLSLIPAALLAAAVRFGWRIFGPFR